MISHIHFAAADQTLKALAQQGGRAATLSQIQKAYPDGRIDTQELIQDIAVLQERGLAQAQASIPPRFFITVKGLEEARLNLTA
jgi:hypothetical protein